MDSGEEQRRNGTTKTGPCNGTAQGPWKWLRTRATKGHVNVAGHACLIFLHERVELDADIVMNVEVEQRARLSSRLGDDEVVEGVLLSTHSGRVCGTNNSVRKHY